ncbi:MAG: hypothetical protein JXA79_12950 [Deltaproteobacteria bacterium]|nr:hypothetical protein [Deltaproteobacteria bacterium]
MALIKTCNCEKDLETTSWGVWQTWENSGTNISFPAQQSSIVSPIIKPISSFYPTGSTLGGYSPSPSFAMPQNNPFTNSLFNFPSTSFPPSYGYNQIGAKPMDKTVDRGVIEWELLNPAGARKIEPEKLAPRLTTLEGKTVAFFWNNKPNGNLFLERIAELLTEQVNDITVIKLWEVLPNTENTTTSLLSPQQLEEIAELSPDLVIGSQCD